MTRTKAHPMNPTGNAVLLCTIEPPKCPRPRSAFSLDGYGAVRLYPAALDSDKYPTQSRYALPDGMYEITLSCQTDPDHGSRPYAFRISTGTADDSDEARSRLRIHTTVERHLERVRERYGNELTSTFAGWVCAVAEALGITMVGLNGQDGPSADRHGIRWGTPAFIMSLVTTSLSHFYDEDEEERSA